MTDYDVLLWKNAIKEQLLNELDMVIYDFKVAAVEDIYESVEALGKDGGLPMGEKGRNDLNKVLESSMTRTLDKKTCFNIASKAISAYIKSGHHYK